MGTHILQDLDYQVPKAVFSVISMFYSNDITKNRSYRDYVNALLICKHFVFLKGTERNKLNDNNKKIKKNYKLTKKSVFTTKKIMAALKQFDDEKHTILDVPMDKLSDFEIIFVDHIENKFNLKRYSYPNGTEYTLSEDELDIITAIRDTQQLNKLHPIFYNGTKSAYYRSNELISLTRKMNFKTGKTSIRYHTIIEYRDNMLYGVDYENIYSYFLFVFRFFTIIIHDKMTGDRHTTRTFQSRSIAAKYRGILDQFDRTFCIIFFVFVCMCFYFSDCYV